MKIGLLTYYGDLNFGTNMQAFASLKALKTCFPNDQVEIIPFHGFYNRTIPYKSWSIKSVIRDIRRIVQFFQFKRCQLEIKGKDPNIVNVQKALAYIERRGYNTIFIGADTLLELDRLPKGYDGLSAYWLKGVHAKKILLAASAKNVVWDKLSLRQTEEMQEAISQFAKIGVRDRVTYQLFDKECDSKKLCYLPDPTFTYQIDYRYAEEYVQRKNLNIPNKSILIHPYGKDEWLDNVVPILKKEGYYIATMRPKKWADVVLNDLGPLEQTGIYHFFSCVITHRFHDSVFCLKNHTPFLIYVRDKGTYVSASGESKQTSLLKDFNLYPQGFLGYTDDGISALKVKAMIEGLKQNVNWEEVDKIQDVFRDRYYGFIKTC